MLVDWTSAQGTGLVQGADAPKVSVLLGSTACETWIVPFSLLTKPGTPCAMLSSNSQTLMGDSIQFNSYLIILVVALSVTHLKCQSCHVFPHLWSEFVSFASPALTLLPIDRLFLLPSDQKGGVKGQWQLPGKSGGLWYKNRNVAGTWAWIQGGQQAGDLLLVWSWPSSVPQTHRLQELDLLQGSPLWLRVFLSEAGTLD